LTARPPRPGSCPPTVLRADDGRGELLVVTTESGAPVAVLTFTVTDGQITAIDALAGSTRVAGLGLETFDAD
jgi:hypothetical protein